MHALHWLKLGGLILEKFVSKSEEADNGIIVECSSKLMLKEMTLMRVRRLMMECWTKHSPSLGSSHRSSKQTREWRGWNPESVFTTSPLLPCMRLEKGREGYQLSEEEVLGCDLPG